MPARPHESDGVKNDFLSVILRGLVAKSKGRESVSDSYGQRVAIWRGVLRWVGQALNRNAAQSSPAARMYPWNLRPKKFGVVCRGVRCRLSG